MAASQDSTLRFERDRFVAFAFAAADLLLETDAAGTIQYAFGAVRGLTKSTESALRGTKLLDLFSDQDKPVATHLLARLKDGNRMLPTRVALKTEAGIPAQALMGGCRLPNAAGRTFVTFTMVAGLPPRVVGFGKAGLYDRDQFDEIACQRLASTRQTAVDAKLALFVADGLAILREQGDQDTVDRFLDQFASILRASAIGDAAGEIDMEKFGLVFDGNQKISLVENAAQSALDALGLSDRVKLTCDVIDLDPGRLSDADAGRALSYALRLFRSNDSDGFTLTSLSDGAEAILRDTLPRLERLRDTIDDRAFDIVFQPVVHLNGHKVHYFEALTRMTGVGTPGEMISFAEEIGAPTDFDLAVCKSVLENLATQARSGWTPTIAVNLSARSLEGALFVNEIVKLLASYQDVRSQLVFELTETAYVADADSLNQTIQVLRNGGHKVCIDDVGAGTTSFQSLYNLKFDYAKVDGVTVRRACADTRAMSALKAIVKVCGDIGVEVIAEQIEDEREASILRQQGIKFGQGYHYGRPALDFRKYYSDPAPPRGQRAPRRQGAQSSWG